MKKIRFAGIPRNAERRALIESLISCDVEKFCSTGEGTTGIDSIRMHNLIPDYLKSERESKSRGFRKRKTCKNADHSQPCFCLNLKRFQDSQKEEQVA